MSVSVIGAGSVVASSLPPLRVAVGARAKPVRARFTENIDDTLFESGAEVRALVVP